MYFILLLQKFIVDIIRSTRNIRCIWHVLSAENYLTFYEVYTVYNIYYNILNIKFFVNIQLMYNALYLRKRTLKELIRKSLHVYKQGVEESLKNKQDGCFKLRRVRDLKFQI